MRAIDANLIIRYLTGDHPKQSPRARTIIESGPVFTPVTVVLEAEWVLRSACEYRSSDGHRRVESFRGTATDPPTVKISLLLIVNW
jgi:predicted nucleic acid-binding protein